jgi:hypothetical protein
VQSVDEFMTQISTDSTLLVNWKFNGAFSVDLDPTRGGEHVHANFSVSTQTDSTTVKRDLIERYYIIDGKVVTWHQFSIDVK